MYVLIYNPPTSSSYRAPYSQIVECIQAYTREFETHCLKNDIQYFSDNIHFVGDFNFPGINWKTLKGTSHENEFITFLLDVHLTQLVTESTHVDGNTLDLVITNCSETYYCVHSETFSDHFPIFVYTRISYLEMLQSLPTSKQYSRSSLNLTVFNENLNPLYNFLFNSLTFPINFAEIWYQYFHEVLEKSLSSKRRKRQLYPYYFSSHTMHLANCRNSLQRKLDKNWNTSTAASLNLCEQNLSHSIELDKACLVENLHLKDSNHCFKLLRSLKSNRGLPNILKNGDNSSSMHCDILFMRYQNNSISVSI